MQGGTWHPGRKSARPEGCSASSVAASALRTMYSSIAIGVEMPMPAISWGSASKGAAWQL
eukprot:2670895-Alexandrium_andersonii.AAC.1